MLRTFVDLDWITAEPDLAAREAALLEVLERAGVPAPRLLGLDADGEASGSISLLMTLEPGTAGERPDGSAPVDRRSGRGARARPRRGPPPIPNLRDQAGRIELHGSGGPTAPVRHAGRRGALGPGGAALAPRGARRHRRCCTTTTTRATCCGPAAGSRASSTGPAPASVSRRPTSATSARTCPWCRASRRATRCWRPTRRPAARPVPDRPFWDLLAATRAKGAEDWWWGSYVDFGLPVTLAAGADPPRQLIARAIADLG